jgi:hypothetical protein
MLSALGGSESFCPAAARPRVVAPKVNTGAHTIAAKYAARRNLNPHLINPYP